MKIIVLICFLLIALVAIYLGVSVYIANILTTQKPTPINFDEKQIGEKVADVVFRSTDGIQLAGWYYRGTNGKAIIFVHGAGDQNRVNEIYGTPDIAKHYYDLGYSLLLFDLRGIGESQKTRVSFGQHEANDVAGAFNYMVTQEYKPESIGIISDSLGAIATIMAGDDIKGAGGVVLDSPAEEIKSITSKLMYEDNNVPKFLHPGVYFAAKIFYNVDVDKVRPIDHVTKLSSTPLLFLHGENDTLIAPYHSENLYNKAGSGKRIIFPGSKHVETYLDHPQMYFDELDAFFEENLQ